MDSELKQIRKAISEFHEARDRMDFLNLDRKDWKPVAIRLHVQIETHNGHLDTRSFRLRMDDCAPIEALRKIARKRYLKAAETLRGAAEATQEWLEHE